MDAMTIFIPKKSDAVDPADFRPIRISSSLARQFYRILSMRIDNTVEFSEEQSSVVANVSLSTERTEFKTDLLR